MGDMMGGMIGFIIDGLMIVLLAGTIFYAWRLSGSLERFKSNRDDMQGIIRELSDNIIKAQQSIDHLGDTSRVAGDRLQSLIAQARGLSDELQLMNEAGDNLAQRLENLATRSRQASQEHMDDTHAPARAPAASAPSAQPGVFSIRDPDYGRPGGGDEGSADEQPGFRSRAEQDLYDALHGKTKRGAGP